MASVKCVHFLQEYKSFVQIAIGDQNLKEAKKVNYTAFIEMLGTCVKHVNEYEVPKVTLFGYFEITTSLRAKVIAFFSTLITGFVTFKVVYG